MNLPLLCLLFLLIFAGQVPAATVEYVNSFGQEGSPTDVPTDIDETLTVPGWASIAPPMATLTNVQVMLRATITTSGQVTNNSQSYSFMTLIVLERDQNWQAVTTDLAGSDYVFAGPWTTLMNYALGTVGPGETVYFGPITTESAPGWITVFDGLGGGVESLDSITYRFTNVIISTVTGSGNISSATQTASTGALRVVYTYTQPIDLELDKQVSQGPYRTGTRVTFTIRVRNEGPGNATGVAVEDEVPDGFDSIGNISTGGTLSGSTIRWSGLSIPAGGHVDLSFDAVVVSGDHENIAQVMEADQDDVDSTPGNDVPTEDDYDSVSIVLTARVPTLSEWAMLLLSVVLAATAVVSVRRLSTR